MNGSDVNAYRILVGRPYEKDHSEDIGVIGSSVIICFLNKMRSFELHFSGSRRSYILHLRWPVPERYGRLSLLTCRAVCSV